MLVPVVERCVYWPQSIGNLATKDTCTEWQRCKEVGEEFTRLSQADQLILTKMIERQLTRGSAQFREQAEAWLADVLGEDAAALMVNRPLE